MSTVLAPAGVSTGRFDRLAPFARVVRPAFALGDTRLTRSIGALPPRFRIH